MPLYEYECPTCGDTRDDIATIKDRHDGPMCVVCNEPMELQVSSPASPVLNPARPVHKPHNL